MSDRHSITIVLCLIMALVTGGLMMSISMMRDKKTSALSKVENSKVEVGQVWKFHLDEDPFKKPRYENYRFEVLAISNEYVKFVTSITNEPLYEGLHFEDSSRIDWFIGSREICPPSGVNSNRNTNQGD